MPELPEVETIRRDLEKNIKGREITGLELLWPEIVKGSSPKEFENKIVGGKILNVTRRAKNLSVELDNGCHLLFHMKMTGHLIFTDDYWQVDEEGRWQKHEGQESPLFDPLNQYIRAIFSLSGEKILAFSDLRKFAYVKLLTKKEIDDFYGLYGPEPLSNEFTPQYLERIFAKKNLSIKKVLMDQAIVAGIGNIYADEILFAAKIHPLTKANKLSKAEIEKIVKETIRILEMALEMRGTSTSDFRDTEGKKGSFGNVLQVYRRTGLPCYNDGTKIERIVVGGRGTHFCPAEQKVKE